MSARKRRKGYWKSYEPARANDESNLVAATLDLIKKHPAPRTAKESRRGRPPVHSKDKLDFACLMMMHRHFVYRDMEDYMRRVQHP